MAVERDEELGLASPDDFGDAVCVARAPGEESGEVEDAGEVEEVEEVEEIEELELAEVMLK